MHTFRAAGSKDIDASFGLAGRFDLLGIRIHFRDINSGASTLANVTLSLVSVHGVNHDVVLWTFDGTDAGGHGLNDDVNWRVPHDELLDGAWTFEGGDQVKLAWTNPDANNIGYGIEVRLRDAAN